MKLAEDVERTDRIAVMDDGEVVAVACRPRNATATSEVVLHSGIADRWKLEGSQIPTLTGDAIAITHSIDPLAFEPQILLHGNTLCEIIYEDDKRRDALPPSSGPVVMFHAWLSGMSSENGRNMICAAFEPDNSWLVTGHRDGRLNFYRTGDGDELLSVQASQSAIRALAVSPNGEMVATTDGSDIVVWTIPKLVP